MGHRECGWWNHVKTADDQKKLAWQKFMVMSKIYRIDQAFLFRHKKELHPRVQVVAGQNPERYRGYCENSNQTGIFIIFTGATNGSVHVGLNYNVTTIDRQQQVNWKNYQINIRISLWINYQIFRKKNIWISSDKHLDIKSYNMSETSTAISPSWWFQPHLKNMSQIGNHFPNFRGETWKIIWNHHLW